MLRSVTASFLLISVLAGNAMAIEADDVLPCLNLMPADYGIGAEVEVSASVSNGLLTDFSVARYAPDTEQGYKIAQRAIIALNMCSPYPGETGDFTITLKIDEPYKSPAIPLPGKQ